MSDDPKSPPVEGGEVSTPKPENPTIPKIVKSIRSTVKDVPIHLACGVIHDGKVYRDISAHSILVSDRKAFGDHKNRNNPAKVITTVLGQKITGIVGGVAIQSNMPRNLLGHDRDQIMFELRDATVPNTPFEEKFQCAHCGSMNQAIIHADEVRETFKEMPDEVRLNVEGHQCVFNIELPDYGFAGKFAHTDGKLQEALGALYTDQANPFELELEILSRICIDFNGEGKVKKEELGDLNIEFLNDLQDAISEHTYGYDLAVSTSCYSCGGYTKVRVNTLDFLFQGERKRLTHGKPTT